MSTSGVDGAAAAAQYFFELYNYAYASGDTEPLLGMSDPACVFCASVVESVRDTMAVGGTTSGGAIEATISRSLQVSEEFFSVDATVVSEPSEIRDRQGALLGSAEGGTGTAVVIVLGSPGHWTVRAVETHRTEANP